MNSSHILAALAGAAALYVYLTKRRIEQGQIPSLTAPASTFPRNDAAGPRLPSMPAFPEMPGFPTSGAVPNMPRIPEFRCAEPGPNVGIPERPWLTIAPQALQ